ncbi:50S ribosomal protein L11 methyltransferase [Ruminococcaceae bacterium OttesenSCG-928-A16]|nr:50S ribosomal protein L11 methyltransferase [Ruminococcaceae bacterium OttesenSCG-928-A16]
MEWTDVCIQVPKAQAEVAADIATGISGGGLYIEDYSDLEEQVLAIAHIDLIEQELVDKPRDVVKIHLYLSPEENPAEVLDLLHSRLFAAGIDASLATAGVQQEDWETAWKKYYHPIEVGRRLAVVPSWEDYPENGRVRLTLDPGMAFGTGTHETTFLCLELLDTLVQGGETVLDIGTGSGILAVAALLLGASTALGIDIDPMCVRTATENAQRNHVQQNFLAEAGDLAAKTSGQYHIITANIVADAIKKLAPDVTPLLAPGGTFIASGIIQERADEVVQALQAAGLVVKQVERKNGWVALVAGRNG